MFYKLNQLEFTSEKIDGGAQRNTGLQPYSTPLRPRGEERRQSFGGRPASIGRGPSGSVDSIRLTPRSARGF
jgi:hypothetical protein